MKPGENQKKGKTWISWRAWQPATTGYGVVKNEKIEQVFSVNVFGPVYAMRKAVQVFLSQGDGGAYLYARTTIELYTEDGLIQELTVRPE